MVSRGGAWADRRDAGSLTRVRCPFVHLSIALIVLLSGAPAHADDWADARREFRVLARSQRWQDRASGYQLLLDYDGEKAFEEELAAALKEENAAVLITAIESLGQFETPGARKIFLKGLQKPRGKRGMLLLMASGVTKGDFGADALVDVLRGKDARQAALAANALGSKKTARGLFPLLEALHHKAWQVASAAARAIEVMAWSDRTRPDPKRGTEAQPKMPSWFDVKKVSWPLIDALEVARGTLRGDLIRALEKIHRKDYGDNWEAWVALARGEEVTPKILRKRTYPPSFFGVPVYGRRVVIVMDASVLTENLHPFTERTRLQELCKVPGGRDVPWFKIRSIKQFLQAWVRRFLMDTPTSGRRVELVFSGAKPAPVFGKLQGLNPGSRTKALEALDKVPAENDNDILATMTYALDISGAKDGAAWTKGPDEICCVYASVPWRAAVTDPEVVGAEVGLKARRRQVKIQPVGVHEYAYAMMKLFAAQSGGRYVALTH